MQLQVPFDLVRCSWPRPVEQQDGCWTSEPEWDAPALPFEPMPRLVSTDGQACWLFDWCELFDGDLRRWGQPRRGEMRNFHVVFRLRMAASGVLVFWDDDGCVIRRNGEAVHADRTSHPPLRHELTVEAGDCLDVAQWQYYGGWTWAATLEPHPAAGAEETSGLDSYLDAVQRRLAESDGPPLKVYCGGVTPLRTVTAIYSMILNGYRPERVLVFGEYQWPEAGRRFLTAHLPFAEIVPTEAVLAQIARQGQRQLVDWARAHPLVMKTCVGVLHPPDEYCLMDDDVFVLKRVDEALEAFERCNLVFAPDGDYGGDYLAAWRPRNPTRGTLPTARLNAGLYWLRNQHEKPALAAEMLRLRPEQQPTWQWEQGFLATHYAGEPIFELPAQRYFYPYFDGLPGGMLGYDYAGNPCGFVSIHFGGLVEKPSDAAARLLAPDILGSRA